jgi:hypothetical protein
MSCSALDRSNVPSHNSKSTLLSLKIRLMLSALPGRPWQDGMYAAVSPCQFIPDHIVCSLRLRRRIVSR